MLEIAVERAIGRKLRVLAYVEGEAYAIENLVEKMEQGRLPVAPIWSDLRTFDATPFRGMVDILAGGYPCTPFSHAGKRKGKEDPRHLWPYIRKAIRIIQPTYCFFENVEGHVTLGLREVLSDLVALGYRVAGRGKEPTWGLFSAREVGATHRRKRVFVMAYLPESRGGRLQPNAVRQGATLPDWVGKAMDNSDGDGHLADSTDQGPQRHTGSECAGKCDAPESGRTRWPAGPGQPQHDWEPPRAIPAQSRVGRNFDELATGVDQTYWTEELRLLGGGVVPQTAELAFKTLIRRMHQPKIVK